MSNAAKIMKKTRAKRMSPSAMVNCIRADCPRELKRTTKRSSTEKKANPSIETAPARFSRPLGLRVFIVAGKSGAKAS
jgi:hypothetical protein